MRRNILTFRKKTSREMFMFEKNLKMSLKGYNMQKWTGIELVIYGT
jgi:hypothetical protein